MAVAGTVAMTGSAAKVDGMVKADSAGTRAFTVAVGSMEEAFTAVAASTVVEAVSMAVVVADSTVEAGPTAEATGSCGSRLLSQSRGWQENLPAVFFCF
jgi:hypothetical protein